MQLTRSDTTRLLRERERVAGEDPLYGVAMLKMAMELKRQPGRDLEEVMVAVLRRMRLSEPEFRRYLAQNGALLRAVVKR
jgi:hypothetical protein